jgi:hypothetical protein
MVVSLNIVHVRVKLTLKKVKWELNNVCQVDVVYQFAVSVDCDCQDLHQSVENALSCRFSIEFLHD